MSEDTIRGLNDFANYLRKFGYGCKVIEPKELKEKMIFSVKRALDRYNEIELEEKYETNE